MSLEARVEKLETTTKEHGLLIAANTKSIGGLEKDLENIAIPSDLGLKIDYIHKNASTLEEIIAVTPSIKKVVDGVSKYGLLDEIPNKPITPEEVIKNSSVKKDGKTTEKTSQSKPKNINIWFQTFYGQNSHVYQKEDVETTGTLGLYMKYTHNELFKDITATPEMKKLSDIADSDMRLKKKATFIWKFISKLDKLKSETQEGLQARELVKYCKKFHDEYKKTF